MEEVAVARINEVINKMNGISAQLNKVTAALSDLVEKTEHTNELLKSGIKTRWGHSMSVLEMDPDRFKKNEGKNKHF